MLELFLLILKGDIKLNTIYDYFKEFDRIETPLLKIEREIMKWEGFIVFRVFKKRIHENRWQYIGLTYLELSTINKEVDKNAIFYKNFREDFIVKVKETPILKIYIPVIQILLTNYLRSKVLHYHSLPSNKLIRKQF